MDNSLHSLHIKLPDAIYEELQKEAEVLGVSMSAIIRIALHEHFSDE